MPLKKQKSFQEDLTGYHLAKSSGEKLNFYHVKVKNYVKQLLHKLISVRTI
jgi:hypothetical protein